jgi:hypothetical protein
MKTKLLLLLLLVPFFTFAKYYKATITFSDGKAVTGFAETPKMKDSKVNFKATEKGEKQEFETNSLESIIFTFDNNVKVTYVATNIYEIKGFKYSNEPSKDKYLLILVYDGIMKIYCENTNSAFLGNNKSGVGNDDNYYMKSKNKKYPQFVFTNMQGFSAGKFNYIKKTIKKYLEDDCPNIEDLLLKDDVKEKGFGRIGEIYDETCGK